MLLRRPLRPVSCSGENDDPNATDGFRNDVEFGWGGERTDGRRGFDITGMYDMKVIGTADLGLSEFHVDGALGLGSLTSTRNDAPRGHVGGPIALHVEYHGGIFPGYHLNFNGWIPRTGTAP